MAKTATYNFALLTEDELSLLYVIQSKRLAEELDKLPLEELNKIRLLLEDISGELRNRKSGDINAF